MNFCNVLILDIVHSTLDKPFTYSIPGRILDDLKPGCLVKVDFRNQKVKGIVISKTSKPGFGKTDKIKDIISLESKTPVITEELLKVSDWMRSYYICPLARILRSMLPRGLLIDYTVRYDKFVKLKSVAQEWEKLPANAKKQIEIVNFLKSRETNQPIHLKVLKEKVDCTIQPINKLVEKGIISLSNRISLREPVDYDNLENYPPKPPTQEQKNVLKFIAKDMVNNRLKKPVLLHGVTGSGKTEVYLNLIRDVVSKGKQAIVLIPEISLTPQAISRFVGRFGRKVAIIHSKLSVGEKYDEWSRILSGEAQIVLGARSAIFAPLKNLGLVIIDEEHENTYKQEESPRYHAKEVAVMRCRLNNAGLILGSATPSLESYYMVQKGKYRFAKLKKRINEKTPEYKLVDMRKELAGGNKSIFSRHLVKEMKRALDAKGRILLFLNRRGYSTFVLCRSCGHVVRCNDCEVSLTYHKRVEYLRCHYCDYIEPVPKACPSCNSSLIKSFGAGTQRIESEVKKFFPWIKTLRMDVDTTSRKNAHEEILNKFDKKEAEVLIGTQMIAKGLDFPDISLVGVISADTILNIPDFRSGERTYQLLSQVAGRGGRGEKIGRVLIQTYTPEHYSIRAMLKDDYENFAAIELDSRGKLQYPPFKKMIKFNLRGTRENEVEHCGSELAKELKSMLEADLVDIEIFGPHPCPLYKLRGEYRWQVIVKGYCLREFKEKVMRNNMVAMGKNYKKDVKIVVDVDPISLL